MDSLVIIALLWALYLLTAFLYARRNREGAENSFRTAQVVLVVGAFALAAYWYFVERKSQPHADVSQTVAAVAVSPGLVAVEAHIAIKNLGAQLLRIESAKIMLQRVNPPGDDYETLRAEQGDAYWDAAKPNRLPNGNPNPFFDAGELRWAPLRTFDRKIHHEIEPGETDLLVTTFLQPCDVKIVRVLSNIRKQPGWFKSDQPLMSWKARSFVDLSEACGGGAAAPIE